MRGQNFVIGAMVNNSAAIERHELPRKTSLELWSLMLERFSFLGQGIWLTSDRFDLDLWHSYAGWVPLDLFVVIERAIWFSVFARSTVPMTLIRFPGYLWPSLLTT